MENYVVSARKYRPNFFRDLVGQVPVVTTLQNAIRSKQLAHAFLFCGPRGVGKTTCARILAKAINCQRPTVEAEPCNNCPSCTSLNDHTSFNIYELDAASNNSVEDIRSLVEQVRYPPQQGLYKIYIIDEVHMLSPAAFNAFLKTLEEPPSYAIFILATTERHKVLPTILSRCQLFDFQRITPEGIVEQLKRVAEQEAIPYDIEALHFISQKADGALRDALSIFDVLVGFGAGQLTYQATIENLHILDHSYYFRLATAFVAGDIPTVLLMYEEIVQRGFDGVYFLEGLLGHFRNLLVAQDVTTVPLLTTVPSVQEKYRAQAAVISPTFLLEALRIINLSAAQYKESINKRFHIELALIELARQVQPAGKGTVNESKQSVSPIPRDAVIPPAIAAHTLPLVPKDPLSTVTLAQTQPMDKVIDSLPISADAHTTITPQKKVLPNTIKLPQLDSIKVGLEKSMPMTPVVSPAKQQPVPLVYETVLKYWKGYAQRFKLANRILPYNLLQKPFQLSGNTISLTFTNTIEEHILAEIREELLHDLRKDLQNVAIEVVGVLTTSDVSSSSRPYTAQEKFHYLSHKNPALGLFKEQLQLEVMD